MTVQRQAATAATTGTTALVRVEGVSQVFERGRPPVLQGMDLTVAPGDRVRLGLDTRTLHFFEAESEQALL